MAESSQFWDTTGTGDGLVGGYTENDWIDFIRYLFLAGYEASAGVLPLGSGSNLACSGVATPIAVAAGAAIVYGFFYKNTASVNLAVTTPVVNTTGGHVVLRVNWAAQTVRLFAVRNTDGVAAIPALTQTAGTTWEIRLCSFTITTGGVITSTDTREYAQHATRIGRKRQGGSISNWGLSGATNYDVGAGWEQFGVTSVTFTAQNDVTVAVTFPVAYANGPLVFVQCNGGLSSRKVYAITDPVNNNNFTIRVRTVDGVNISDTIAIAWLARGL